MTVWSAFAAAVILSWTSGTASGLPRQPTGKWVVHFDDAQCLAERNYGTKQDPLHLVLKRPPLGNAMQLSVIRAGPSQDARELEGKLEFPGRPPQKVRVLQFGPRKTKRRVMTMNLPLDQFSPARTATAVRIQTEDFDETFALAQLGPLLDVVNTCVEDLKKVWNVDQLEQSEGVVREDVKGDLRGLLSSNDYPREALARGDDGTVKIALLVDETGRVADCSVIQTSGVAALDAQSCVVLKERARFTPATGKDGKPEKDAFIQTIKWKLR